jgi:uncharacterized damage-inducible protein DinB
MRSKRHPAAADPRSGEIAILLQALDEGYERKAWHGPNLKGSIRGVPAESAAWRPRPDRHSIADNVAHAAYWKYAVRRRLTGEKRGSFALKGSNWFTLSSPLTESRWKQYTALLDAEHRALRDVVASFPRERLQLFPQVGKVSYLNQILGIAMHDVYHAGQIQLLKRLQIEPK